MVSLSSEVSRFDALSPEAVQVGPNEPSQFQSEEGGKKENTLVFEFWSNLEPKEKCDCRKRCECEKRWWSTDIVQSLFNCFTPASSSAYFLDHRRMTEFEDCTCGAHSPPPPYNRMQEGGTEPRTCSSSLDPPHHRMQETEVKNKCTPSPATCRAQESEVEDHTCRTPSHPPPPHHRLQAAEMEEHTSCTHSPPHGRLQAAESANHTSSQPGCGQMQAAELEDHTSTHSPPHHRLQKAEKNDNTYSTHSCPPHGRTQADDLEDHTRCTPPPPPHPHHRTQAAECEDHTHSPPSHHSPDNSVCDSSMPCPEHPARHTKCPEYTLVCPQCPEFSVKCSKCPIHSYDSPECAERATEAPHCQEHPRPPCPSAPIAPIAPVEPVVPVAPEVRERPVVIVAQDQPVLSVAPLVPIAPLVPVAPLTPAAPIELRPVNDMNSKESVVTSPIVVNAVPPAIYCAPSNCYHKSNFDAVMCCVTKILSVAFQLGVVGASLFYFYKWWYLRKDYQNTIEEVREAQNERIRLENELQSLKSDPHGARTQVYDNIGDTQKLIILQEIDRMTSFNEEAKKEINALKMQRDQLKIQLERVERERDVVKGSWDRALRDLSEDKETTSPLLVANRGELKHRINLSASPKRPGYDHPRF